VISLSQRKEITIDFSHLAANAISIAIAVLEMVRLRKIIYSMAYVVSLD
jgi:hypothetical protein